MHYFLLLLGVLKKSTNNRGSGNGTHIQLEYFKAETTAKMKSTYSFFMIFMLIYY